MSGREAVLKVCWGVPSRRAGRPMTRRVCKRLESSAAYALANKLSKEGRAVSVKTFYGEKTLMRCARGKCKGLGRIKHGRIGATRRRRAKKRR